MSVLAVLAGAMCVVNAWSYLRSADFRLRRWVWHGGIQCYVAFGLAEVARFRVRLVDVDRGMRRRATWQPITFGLLILAVGTALLLLDAAWWVAIPLITLVVLPSISPLRSMSSALRGIAQHGDAERRTGRRALFLIVASWSSLIVSVSLLWNSAIAQDAGQSLTRWLSFLLLSLVLLAFTGRLAIISKRLAASAEGIRFGTDPSADDTLFLRSFNDDAMRIRAIDPHIGYLRAPVGNLVRFEELVAAFIQGKGTMIAIGKPGEPLPELGSVRTYVADDEWQSVVESTAHRVGSIYIVAGLSDGLAWELNHLAEWGLLKKAIVLLPPVDESQAWSRLHRILGQMGVEFEGTDASDGEWLGVVLRTVTAVGLSDNNHPVFYVAERRDWIAYAATIMASQNYIRGMIEPPQHGRIAQSLGQPISLEPQ
jgi:hypothetical protein